MTHCSLPRSAMRVALVSALLLLVPLLAMTLTPEVNWGIEDFAAAGALIFTAGMLYVTLARPVETRRRRIALALGIAVPAAAVWAELAVGLFR